MQTYIFIYAMSFVKIKDLILADLIKATIQIDEDF